MLNTRREMKAVGSSDRLALNRVQLAPVGMMSLVCSTRARSITSESFPFRIACTTPPNSTTAYSHWYERVDAAEGKQSNMIGLGRASSELCRSLNTQHPFQIHSQIPHLFSVVVVVCCRRRPTQCSLLAASPVFPAER